MTISSTSLSHITLQCSILPRCFKMSINQMSVDYNDDIYCPMNKKRCKQDTHGWRCDNLQFIAFIASPVSSPPPFLSTSSSYKASSLGSALSFPVFWLVQNEFQMFSFVFSFPSPAWTCCCTFFFEACRALATWERSCFRDGIWTKVDDEPFLTWDEPLAIILSVVVSIIT